MKKKNEITEIRTMHKNLETNIVQTKYQNCLITHTGKFFVILVLKFPVFKLQIKSFMKQ